MEVPPQDFNEASALAWSVIGLQCFNQDILVVSIFCAAKTGFLIDGYPYDPSSGGSG
jgi:hypothetical protein